MIKLAKVDRLESIDLIHFYGLIQLGIMLEIWTRVTDGRLYSGKSNEFGSPEENI